ncbi:hypothetical protein [Streptomyces sp. NPDC006140]|uniref:type I-G CRISPR-associated protein, Cas3-extension family n=1 Tax=Streptomyces sp. NPDC006140 TaxID=3154579 RepID=UPI00340C6ED2
MTKYVPVELPGLVGDEPLGFLAAIGLINQLSEVAYLSWSPESHWAIVHCDASRYSGIDDLVSALLRRLDKVKPGWAIPYETDFPLRRRSGGPDPLRMRPDEFRARTMNRYKGGLSWLKAALTDEATDADGYCAVTPYIAVRGRQTIGSFWYYPMLEVRKEPRRLLTEALTGWRRVEGADGWLLDPHASYSTYPEVRGPAGSMAVPGATWLATLAVGEFPFQSRSSRAVQPIRPTRPILWHHLDGQDVLMWPLWTLPARGNTLHAVWNVGWRSGAWELQRLPDETLEVRIRPTHGVAAPDNIDRTVDLGIFTMCAATRPHNGQMPAPLTPVPIQTRRDLPEKYGDYPAWSGSQRSSF